MISHRKSNLSALSLLWISLTSMIGSGWLFGSLYSAHFAGPAAILAWPIAGFLLLFVALAYAEVAIMFPEADTLTRLPFYTHGRLTSMIMNGFTWVSLATIPAIETQGLVQYASNYIPHLMWQRGMHYLPTSKGYLIETLILMSFILLNYFGIRLFARINSAFTIWKLFIPTFTIILLLTVYHAGNFFHYDGFMPYGWHGVMAAISNGGVLFSLLGFRQAVIMMGEIEKPEKYVPLVLIGSLFFGTLLYTGLQLAFIGSLRPEDLLSGWRLLSFPGDAGPFAALALLAGFIGLSTLLYADAVISPYSTGLVYSTTAARMLANMDSIAKMPRIITQHNQYNVPWVSLVFNFFLAMIMLFTLHGWDAMASFLVAVMLVTYSVGPISLICLRKQLPHHHRPFRLRGSTFIALIGFYVCTAGIYWTGFSSIKRLLQLTIIYLLFLIVYYAMIKKSWQNLESKHALWLITYFFGLGVLSYFGNYGGNHVISPRWELVCLFIFSVGIFIFAIFSRKKSVGHISKY